MAAGGESGLLICHAIIFYYLVTYSTLWTAVFPPKCLWWQPCSDREINLQNCARNMAKKGSGSAKEKLGKTSSVSRSCVSNKPNGISQRSSRSSPKTTTLSTKRDLKSTRRTRVPSPKELPANRHDCKEGRTKRGSCSGKKRNSSHQEPNESTSKKPKMDSSQVQKEETANTLTKDFSLKGNRKKDGKSKQLPSKKQNPETVTPQIYSKQELTVEKKYSKQKSPLKNTHEATPENLQGSPRKDNIVGKRLKLDLVANAGKDMAAKNDSGGSSCDESSDEESVAWEDVDEAHVADHRLKDHETEASTSHQQHSPSKKSVEISITVPGAKKKKKGWNQEDIMKYVKRAVNRFRKEVSINVHKVHVLALVAHGMFRNSICNDPLLQAVLLSHVPNDFVSGNKRKWDVAQLTNFLKWFQSEFTSIDDGRTGEKEADKQVDKLQNLTEVFIIILRALGFLTRLAYSMQPISAKGDLDSKSSPTTSNKKTLKGSQTTVKRSSKESSKTSTLSKKQRTTEKKGIKTENEGTTPSSKSVSFGSGSNCGSSEQNEEQVEKCLGKNSRKLNNANCAVKAPKRKSHVDKVSVEHMDHVSAGKKSKLTTRPLRKRKRVDYSLSGSNNGSDADEEWNGQSSDDEESSDEKSLVPRENSKTIKEKTPLARKKKSTGSDNSSPSGNSSLSFVDLMDDDSDFEVTSKPLHVVQRPPSAESSQRKKKVVKMVSSDESDERVKCLGYVSNEQGVNWWAEVYLPVDKKWICAHLESSSINHPELCEKQATQPLVYVVTFDNKSSIKDVTNRYASSWMSKTRKLRIDSDWWEDTLRPYKSKNKKMMEMEDSHLEDQLLDKPLPTSITEYKNHPLYVLKRHLLKFEAIYPETAAILGYCRSEAVYSRECVHTLHTREKWLNEALVVKQGEKAYKVVKGRPKRNQPIHERDSVTIDLFGRWQTEKYKPPPAKDGKVPRNEYGNVELFLPCMLPPGTKHVQINGIHRVAKKLGIDCAQAVVGFDFHCGFSHPVIDGVVVCEEFEQVLLDAWKEEEEQAEKRKAEKREKRMLANWRLLTRSLLIRERLKKRYDTEEANVAETSNDGEDEMITATSISWPLNRQEGKSSVASDGHCHVFPASGHKQDPVTGEWTKSCSCGLTLPFEKM